MKRLLSVVELGGYPNFTPLYQRHGYTVDAVASVRKATAQIRKTMPDVVVAEFNFQSDFRDRTSSLETLLATLERFGGARSIVFYDQEYAHQLERLTARFPIDHLLPFPVAEADVGAALEAIAAGG
ncbi:MAG: hypothetical protein KDG50_11985 [Chromatiales bacterium]|nr:hypothetical protein [Chromatiales bacterium]